MKKQFHKLLKMTLVLSGLSVIGTTTLSAQTYAPYITDPFNIIGIGGATDPTFADLDNDGDLDVFSGTNAGGYGSSLIYHQNIGTKRNPNFAPGVIDPFSFDINLQFAGGFFDPTFVDLDNDDDLDMMVGNQGGESKYFENTGTVSAPNFALMVTNPFGLYSIGYLSSPTFADIDNDGDQDLLVGEYYGPMYYFLNIGTASSPVFGTHQILPFGLSNVGNAPKPQFIDLDKDGDQDLLVGVENGSHYYFQNIGNPAAPTFAPALLNPFGISSTPTIYCSPVFADLDFDGDMDILSGDNTNAFKYFENTTPVPIPSSPTSNSTAEDAYVCYGTSATLTASGVITGTLGWYDAPTGGNWLGGGETFTTSSLTSNMTIYVQDSTNGGPSTNRIAINITVTSQVEAQTITASSSNLCGGGFISIDLGFGESGVIYTLYDVTNDSSYGSVTGNSNPISFGTPFILSTRELIIIAETTSIQGAITLSCTQSMNPAITITVNQPATHTETIELCHGGNYTYADGTAATDVTAYVSHVSTLTGVAANGCDSIVTENINPLPELTSSINTTLCAGESIAINGTVYDSSNPTGTEVFMSSGALGCDSTVTINLNVIPALESTITATICAEESMTINGTVYDASNPTGTEVFTNVGTNGCDSTVTIDLTVLPAITSTYSPIVCLEESIVINGTTYDITHMGGTEVFTSTNGCDSIVTINLLIPAINTFTTISGMTIMALPGMTYQWINCSNNQPISGATAQSFTATANGNYAVIVTQDGCSDTSQCIAVTSLGLNEFTRSALSLYPNPTENSFTISGLENLSGIGAIQILDLNGKQINSIPTNSSTYDVSPLESGMYYLKVIHENGTEMIRFVKK
jgi:hypothetical protein